MNIVTPIWNTIQVNWMALSPKGRATISVILSALLIVVARALLQVQAGQTVYFKEVLDTLFKTGAGAVGVAILTRLGSGTGA